jgi:Ca2+-transporting ATPase
MSRVWQSPDLRHRMISAKGAPEAIVDLCHMDASSRAAVAAQVALMAGEGWRVLGVARSTFAAARLPGNQHDFEFEFLGLVALEDPMRPDVPQAIADCRAAGIRVVMITGDHAATALSIARQAGLRAGDHVMTGTEIARLDDEALARRLADTDVFSRVQPEQKLRLVQAFRARGDVVAMTGDGVNDAPALKAADIGVAMGARGTDVAREAAALVLLDDDFSSLVTAVRHGRRVFANLRKAIVFVVAVHVPIVGLSILPVLFGWPMILLPVHILFLQLVIDPACSVVFEAEPLEADAMTVPPRRPDARLFDTTVLLRGLWQGLGLLAMLLGVYAMAWRSSGSHEVARALAFSVLVLSNLGLIFANRVWRRSTLLSAGSSNRPFVWISIATVTLLACILGIPALSRLFAFVAPSPAMLSAGVGAAMAGLLWFEAVKWGLERRWAARRSGAATMR